MIIRNIGCLVVLLFGVEAVAQAPQAGNGRPLRSRIALSNLTRAKMDFNGVEPELILMLESYRQERGEGLLTLTEMVTKTRTVKVDGKEVEQFYSVAVPVTKRIKDAVISIPAGIKPVTFPAEKFRFYDLLGNSMGVEDAAKHLAKLTPVFVLEDYHGTVEGLPEIQRAALHPDCLIITTRDVVRTKPGPVKPISTSKPGAEK